LTVARLALLPDSLAMRPLSWSAAAVAAAAAARSPDLPLLQPQFVA